MAQRGTVFGVADAVFDAGAQAVPGLICDGFGRGGHVTLVAMNE